MTNCPNCGSNYKSNIRDCEYCGTSLLVISLSSLDGRNLDNGKLDAAITKNKLSEQNNPESFESLYNLGILYLNKKIIDVAIAYFRKAIAIKPDDTNSRFNLALCLYKDGYMKLASPEATDLKEQLKTILLLDPNHKEANGFHAFFEARYNEKNFVYATNNYKKAIEYCDDIIVFYYNLSTLYFQNKMWEQSIEIGNKFLNSNITVNYQNEWLGNLYNVMGTSYQMAKNKKKAIECIELAIKYNPTHPQIIKNLATIKKTFYIFGKAFTWG
jgi:tetratricopeptide (TPR) repeat protein